jgi:hypothetical protein
MGYEVDPTHLLDRLARSAATEQDVSCGRQGAAAVGALRHHHRVSLEDALKFLSFEEWLARKEHRRTDRIVVALHCEEGTTRWATRSALLPMADDALDRLFADATWELGPEMAHPTFIRTGEDSWEFDDGAAPDERGLRLLPFEIQRSFHGYIPNRSEFDQTFLLYHEASFHEASGEYRRVTLDGEIATVAWIRRREDCELLEVDTHHLRDYLAARKCYLARFHDHTRTTPENILPGITGDFEERELRDDDYRFDLWLRRDNLIDTENSHSRLLGKDVIRPYSKPSAEHLWWERWERRAYERFIVGRRDDGTLEEVTCNDAELSNYFTDRGTPHFLTPVYFRRDVLAHYYAAPSRYRVEADAIWCLGIWHMPYATSGDLVQVWLGDLGKLPYSEQRRWRSFNVEQGEGVPEYRIRRDFLAQWVETEDAVHKFKREFERLNEAGETRFGSPLFLSLRAEDQHLYSGLRVPLNEDWPEFDGQLAGLAKITADSLNVDLLEVQSGKSMRDEEIKGSLDLLEAALATLGAEPEDADALTRPLRNIQGLRSAATGHRKGSNFDKIIDRLGLAPLSNHGRIQRLVDDATRTFRGIRALVEPPPQGQA